MAIISALFLLMSNVSQASVVALQVHDCSYHTHDAHWSVRKVRDNVQPSYFENDDDESSDDEVISGDYNSELPPVSLTAGFSSDFFCDVVSLLIYQQHRTYGAAQVPIQRDVAHQLSFLCIHRI